MLELIMHKLLDDSCLSNRTFTQQDYFVLFSGCSRWNACIVHLNLYFEYLLEIKYYARVYYIKR